jgi:cation-transporting ATPase 13A1
MEGSSLHTAKKVHTFKLLKKKTTFWRLDILPFPFTIGAFLYFFSESLLKYDFENIFLVIGFIIFVTFHAFVFLLNFWSGAANSVISFNSASSIQEATHGRVTIEHKQAQTLKTYIVPLKAHSVERADGRITTSWSIEFHKKKMIWNQDKKTFLSIPFPVNNTIGNYQAAEGMMSQNDKFKADLVWGPNRVDVPIPSFFDIYKEHMVAPFFVFQVFCTFLWMLDEYWYYSLMSFSMILMFEGTVVTQRL